MRTFEDNPWPAGVLAKAREAFPDGLGGRTFKALDLRIQHALKVWEGRYAMNPEQSRYAGDVLMWAFDEAAKHPGLATVRGRIYFNLDRVAHDERVHQGFVRRAGLVDVRAQLAELSA